MSPVMDAIAPPTQELLPAPLYFGLIISKHFDPEALAAEVEDALRFVWPDPDPLHQITETSWNLYDPAELLALIEENERAAAQRQAAIDDPHTLGTDALMVNGVLYHNHACDTCGHIRLMPTDATLCIPCGARTHLEDDQILNIAEELFALPATEDPHWMEPDDEDDEHPVTIQVAADITPDELAELIILHPYAEVWRGMVAATNPIDAGHVWDEAMTIADQLTAP